MPAFTAENENLLAPFSKVRIILDKPKSVIPGERLSGRFRKTDIRWSPEIYTIGNIILQDGQPPLYLVKNEDDKWVPVAYTKAQLQSVDDSQEAPPASKVIRGQPTQFVIEKILERRKVGNKIEYKVRWKGFGADSDTWEPTKTFQTKSLKRLVSDFNNENL